MEIKTADFGETMPTVSSETVIGIVFIIAVAIMSLVLWNMAKDEETANAVISRQLERKGGADLFGWQAFCVNGALYIRDPEHGGVRPLFTGGT